MSYSQRQLLINEREKCSLTIDFDECSRAWRENKNVLKMECFPIKKKNKIVVMLNVTEQNAEKKES